MIICQRGKSEFHYHHGSISDLSRWPVLYGVVVTIAGRSIWTSLSRQKVEIKLLKLAEATLNLPVGLFRCVLCTIWIRCCMSLCSVFWSVLSESVNMVPVNCVYRFQGSPNRWEPVRFDRLPVKPVRTGSGFGRYPTDQNSKFKFEFKKWKILKKFLKILQGAMNLMVSNFLKNSFV